MIIRNYRLALILPLLLGGSLVACEPSGPGDTSVTQTESSHNPSTGLVSKNNPYSNPIYPIVDGEPEFTYIADPYVVRDDDGTYYLYCTQTDCYAPSTKQFVRGPIWRSNNLVDWTYAGNVFEDYNPTWGTSGAGVWAPTVIKVGEKWNYYYSLSTGGDANPGIGVAVADTPYGPFEHKGKLFNSQEIGVTNSIDPHVFYDEGRLYMGWGSFGGLITLVELTEDGLGLQGGLEYQKEHKVSLGGYEINELNNYEATFIMKKDGYYYLFLSTGSCCSGASSTYRVVVARSKTLTGPYLDKEGRDMFGPNRGEAVVVPSMSGAMGVGHCAITTDDGGNYWMLYHGYDTTGDHKDSRVLYMDKLLFNEEGWPYVEDRKASNHETLPGPYIASLEEEE